MREVQHIHFPPILYINNVLRPIIPVTTFALLIPLIILPYLGAPSLMRFISITFITIVSSSISIYLFGLTNKERKYIVSILKDKINSFF